MMKMFLSYVCNFHSYKGIIFSSVKSAEKSWQKIYNKKSIQNINIKIYSIKIHTKLCYFLIYFFKEMVLRVKPIIQTHFKIY